STPVERDPFWPIGYDPAKAAIREKSETEKSAPKEAEPEAPTLSDEQLRQLARDESERIRQDLKRKGTMIAGDRIFAYLQDKWVAIGDTLTVEVEGNTYRLEILHLTSDNIELEAHPMIK
ncbi:MAG: hypothetical protein PF795_05155, partial [Kiritimatiellae bacterium]|nr:hypothetical protein [Kiritimatiellia bacterium]